MPAQPEFAAGDLMRYLYCMGNLIRTFSNEAGTWYCGTRERLIGAGLATADMFPQGAETWRGNGTCPAPGELTWAVHRTAGTEFLVMWAAAPPPARSEAV